MKNINNYTIDQSVHYIFFLSKIKELVIQRFVIFKKTSLNKTSPKHGLHSKSKIDQ